MKVLIVDDVKFTLEMAKMAVTDTATEIKTASNGVEALKIMEDFLPDMVLMDLFMPEMNGDECCTIMKSNPTLKNVPVIIISAVDDDESRAKCKRSGCDDIIKKPFKKDMVVEKLMQYKKN